MKTRDDNKHGETIKILLQTLLNKSTIAFIGENIQQFDRIFSTFLLKKYTLHLHLTLYFY